MLLIFSLVSGLAIALTFQLLFANLGLALGLSILDFSPANLASTSPSSADHNRADQNQAEETAGESGISLPLTHLLGAGVMISATSTIFIAALISTEFSALLDLRRGIIFGLVVWALYWLLFTWLSTTTLTSVVESVLGTAIAGGKELLSLTRRMGRSESVQATEDISEESMLKEISDELSGELSQIAAAQKALPRLLSEQREKLIEAVCDRAQLSHTQAEAVFANVQPQLNSGDSPAPSESSSQQADSATSSSVGLLANLGSNLGAVAKSKALSAVKSQVDIPSWEQVSQKIIDNVDVSDLESLWQQTVNFLEDSDTEDLANKQQNEQLNKQSDKQLDEQSSKQLKERESMKAILPASPDSSAVRAPSAATKAFQKKLIAYCRYTNPAALTPEGLAEKIASQQEAKKIEDLSQTQLDVAAITAVVTNRKTLPAAKKQALVNTLESAIAPTRDPGDSSPESSLTHTLSQTKHRIAQYLYSQDKATLQPKQIAHDLTRIVGSGLQAIPHPSQLPARSQIETLWDKSFWQRALEKRKDMTVEEVQQVMQWVESGWTPMTQQVDDWIGALQTEAAQLLEVPEEVIEEVQQQIVEQIGVVKEKAEERAIALKNELQIQADAARKQTALAAWWLFSSILLSSVAAGGAGWLAIRY